MATTGKHFPGHGSVKANSCGAAIDNRSYRDIYDKDMQSFIQLMPQLDALMPAHVIYDQVDPNQQFLPVLAAKYLAPAAQV